MQTADTVQASESCNHAAVLKDQSSKATHQRHIPNILIFSTFRRFHAMHYCESPMRDRYASNAGLKGVYLSALHQYNEISMKPDWCAVHINENNTLTSQPCNRLPPSPSFVCSRRQRAAWVLPIALLLAISRKIGMSLFKTETTPPKKKLSVENQSPTPPGGIRPWNAKTTQVLVWGFLGVESFSAQWCLKSHRVRIRKPTLCSQINLPRYLIDRNSPEK